MEVWGIMGMTFGCAGMSFGLIAFARLARLEKQLKQRGVIPDNFE